MGGSPEQPEERENYISKEFGLGFLAGILMAMIFACVFFLGWRSAQRARQTQQYEEESEETEALGVEVLTDYRTLAKLDEVQSLIGQHYLGEVDSDLLSEYLFRGIAYGLGDDYSDYYSPPELDEVMESSRGVYFGIGISIEEDAQTQEIRIIEVYDGSPAAEAGLAEGDVILAVNGTATEGQDLSAVTDLIRAQEDSFTMKVSREGAGELEFALECGTVELTFVESEMLEHKIGYIRITDFTSNAVGQFRDALEELKGQGMESLVIDLRDNLGGLFDSVKAMLDDILPEGLIVYTENKDEEREEYYSDEKQYVDCEIAVLVNGNTASASEIFAGAVQDYELGPIIGTQTYGKGVVQDTYTLSDGSALKITTQKYFTPKGQVIEGNGITPDIVVEDAPETADSDGTEDAALAKAVEALAS